MVLEAMAILEQQQPVLVDRRRGGMEWDAFRHPGRKGDEQPVLEQLERLHLAAIIRESEKHAVELPAMERIAGRLARSEEHTSELQSLMRISYAVFCLKKKNKNNS